MVCIQCGHKTQVFNSRGQKRLNQVWRRRQCLNCQTIFTSVESAAYEAAWRVQRPNGAIEPYSRDKLFLSLYESCKHRSTAIADARALNDTITARLRNEVRNGILTDVAIARTTLVALNRFDKAAAVHYRAFHHY